LQARDLFAKVTRYAAAFIRAVKARRILEVGTGSGESAERAKAADIQFAPRS